jgi:DNA-binding Lrp family transcriptional regulator
VDARDFAVLRWLSIDGVARFWGSRRVLDPRVTARQIARKVGLSETSVRTRLKSLEGRGLIRGHELWPNPSLFGAKVLMAEVRVRTTRDVARLFEEFALVDGVLLARDFLDLEMRRLQVYYVADTPADTQRRTALLRRLAQPESMTGPVPVFTPPGPTDLGPLDWSVLAAMGRHPDYGVARIADEVGVSLKTAARRFHRLLDDRACWYVPGPDTEDGPWAFVQVRCTDRAARDAVAERLPRMFESWMPLAPESGTRPDADPEREFSGLLLMESLAQLERGIRTLEAVPGVESAYRGFALGTRTYPSWFRRQIEGRIRARPSGTDLPRRSPRRVRTSTARSPGERRRAPRRARRTPARR